MRARTYGCCVPYRLRLEAGLLSCMGMQILIGQLDPLTEQQMMGICGLQHSSEQAEEALAQGLQQLHQSLADTVAAGTLNDGTPGPNYMAIMAIALEKLASLESFYQQVSTHRTSLLLDCIIILKLAAVRS